MKRLQQNLILPLILLLTEAVSSQSYNLRFRQDYPAEQFTSMVAKDSFIYCSGVAADSIFPYRTINVFSKFDLNGNLICNKEFKGDSVTTEVGTFFNSLVRTNDNGFALSGYQVENNSAVTNCLFIKYDSVGNVMFWRSYKASGLKNFSGKKLVQSFDGSYYVTGHVQYIDNSVNIFLLHIDSAGNFLWRKDYGLSSWDEYAQSLIFTPQDKILIVGWEDNGEWDNPNLVSYRYTLLLDLNGNVDTLIMGTNPLELGAMDICHTHDNGYLFARTYITGVGLNGNYGKASVTKIDSNLNTVWTKTYGYESDFFDGLMYEVKELSNGDIVATGCTLDTNLIISNNYHQNGLIIKADSNGNEIWSREYRGITRKGQITEENRLFDFEILDDGSILACGKAQDDNDTFPQQAWLLRVNPDGCMDGNWCGYTGIEEIAPTPAPGIVVRLYPNPAKDLLNIAYETSSETDNVYVRITDLFGREMVHMKTSGGTKKQEINTSAWSNGTFIYEVRVNNERSGSGIFLISR